MMSDKSVAAALRSDKRLVVVEAPAGCGKTFQGAAYAESEGSRLGTGRVLILTHTHAACDVFAARTQSVRNRVDIRTIDSLICEITGAYHSAIGLPSDTSNWARNQKDGYSKLATKASDLITALPMIGRALALRYPTIVCDEHQDASDAQHSIVMACYRGGARLRVFGDPMQRIYNTKGDAQNTSEWHWNDLKSNADEFDRLDHPHRWSDGAKPLGEWILGARRSLQQGEQIDLKDPLPDEVRVFELENTSRQYGQYRASAPHAKPVYQLVRNLPALLIMSSQKNTVRSLRAFFGRQIPIWEGHVRDSLGELTQCLTTYSGDASAIAEGTVSFLLEVTKGFTRSGFANRFLQEVHQGCAKKCSGKPAALQSLARTILDSPDHRGVARMLRLLDEKIKTDRAFGSVCVDLQREFMDAISLEQFDDPGLGLNEVARRRTYSRPSPPVKAISTVHKAKGLQCPHVLLMPCDAKHYSDSDAARCRMYVALSRGQKSLTLVVSRNDPSPLFAL